MKRLSCKEAGILDCNWEIKANTDDEVLRAARDHSRRVHNHEVSPTEENQLRGLIKTV